MGRPILYIYNEWNRNTKRLSGSRGEEPVTWLTPDATLTKDGVINWGMGELATSGAELRLNPFRVYQPKEVHIHAPALATAVYVVIGRAKGNADGDIALMGMGNSNALPWARMGNAIAGTYRELVASFPRTATIEVKTRYPLFARSLKKGRTFYHFHLEERRITGRWLGV